MVDFYIEEKEKSMEKEEKMKITRCEKEEMAVIS